MHTDDMDDTDLAPYPLETCYLSASGFSEADCVYIGQRYDADRGFRPREAECWVMLHNVEPAGVRTSTHIPSGGWYSSAWRSPSGQVFVNDAVRGAVYRCASLTYPQGGLWSDDRFPAAIHGVWGLDDANVYAWGGNRAGFPLYRWDGAQWAEMAAPGFEVFALHGTAPTCLWAVGDAGQVAYWDGARWYPFPTPTRENLTSVFVAERDRVYATGVYGSLLEGATHGWTKVCDGPAPGIGLAAVAWWGDTLWVGARRWGLLRRVGNTDQLEPVEPKIHATHFEAGTNLLITTPERIACTTDGRAFLVAGDGQLDAQTAGRPLHSYRGTTP